MKLAKIQPSGVHVDQGQLRKLKDRMKHDDTFRRGVEIIGFPLEYMAAITSKVKNK